MRQDHTKLQASEQLPTTADSTRALHSCVTPLFTEGELRVELEGGLPTPTNLVTFIVGRIRTVNQMLFSKSSHAIMS